ncbi:MAG: 2OG-Fe dioxygenase family protein [Formosimonas sp.]
MSTLITPPYASRYALQEIVAQSGYALLSPQDLCDIAEFDLTELHAIQHSWNDLPTDNYLKDGGRYRYRRHSCFVFDGGQLKQTPHRAHWQPIAYNALHGGMERWFEPMSADVLESAAWRPLLHALANLCVQLKNEPTWYIEAHQFRIDTTDGIGRPTPEGAHRDGVDFVAVLLVDRHEIKGGETRVFEAAGPNGQRFTLTESWSVLFLDDERVIHESTPIQPMGDAGHRDTLVLTFRRGGFQGSDEM